MLVANPVDTPPVYSVYQCMITFMCLLMKQRGYPCRAIR